LNTLTVTTKGQVTLRKGLLKHLSAARAKGDVGPARGAILNIRCSLGWLPALELNM